LLLGTVDKVKKYTTAEVNSEYVPEFKNSMFCQWNILSDCQ